MRIFRYGRVHAIVSLVLSLQELDIMNIRSVIYSGDRLTDPAFCSVLDNY